jgi:transglutaminase-like putative cysteine protease
MRFSIRHETLYRYPTPVGLAPHVLRLNPRPDGCRILTASLTVDPAPAARHDSTDRFGNRVTHVSFDGLSDLLRIESRFDLENLSAAPLFDLGLPRLPWSSSPHDVLANYRRVGECDAAVEAFAAALAAEREWAALPFLDHLSQTLFTRLERRIRPEGAAQAPAHTLAIGRGACRDLTVLFMAASRSLGIAARFVSGYQARADTPDGQRHLHAWPEVFLPGVGWRGFDPTHGITVTDGHVALCAAPDQADTMPVEGGFYGNGVTATLEYRVQIATT